MPIFLACLLSFARQQQSDFEVDPKLAGKLALVENAVPASAVVADLAKATGVTLTCDPRIRDDLVVLVTKERPAYVIMGVLAKHFDWRWVPTLPGAYKLEPSEDWVRKVREGIPGEMKLDWRRNREKIQEYANELSRLDPAATEEKALAVGKAASDEDGGFFQIWAKRNPFSRIVARTLAGLSDAQLTSLRNRRIVMSTSPGPLETAMPPAVQGEIPAAVRDLAGFEGRMFAAGLEQDLRFNPDAVTEVRFEISRASGAGYVFLGSKHQVLYKGSILVPAAATVPNPPLPMPIQEAIRVQRTPPDWELRPSAPLAGYSGLATKMAQKLDYDLVSDAYDFYFRLRNEPIGWNAFCSVTTGDGWLRVRARRWIIFRSQTIPRNVWAKLGGQLPNNLTLDEKSQLVTMLESEQYRSPLLGWLVGNSAFYRFWAAASPVQRRSLQAGQSVSLAQLPPEVHEFLYLEGDSGGGGFLDDYFFEEPEFDDAKPDESNENEVQIDTDYAGLYPNWLAKDASLTLRAASMPAFYITPFKMLIAPNMLTLSVADLQQVASEPELQGTKPLLSQTTPMRFRFYLAPKIQVDHHELDFKIGKEVGYDPSTWPADLVARIKAATDRNQKKGRSNSGIRIPPP